MASVLYQHIRLDTNEVFYIGIGNPKRPYDKRMRSKFWSSIINKVDYEIEILYTNLTWKEACKLEKEYISLYGRRDLNTGTLCNLTNGGEGGFGTIISNETKLKMSKRKLGKKLSKEHKKNISISLQNSNTPPGAKKVICTITHKIYKSAMEASKYSKLSYTALRAQLSGQNKNRTNFKYLEYAS